METASLRIKFTPLFKNALKNGSKCCLEIVPEVSYVHNLDKISWKQEKNLIEYTIPMTYKIILKKRESQNYSKNVMAVDEIDLGKTYHSCVDLLPPSSMTTFDFASGDVTRMISDTYILGKISAKCDDDKPVLYNPEIPVKAHVREVNQDNSIIELPAVKNTVHEQIVDDTRKPKENDNNAIYKHEQSDQYEHCFFDKFSLNKVTNTENVLTVSKVIETQSVETTTEMSRSRDDSKRKLSLSPICSINTNDKPFPISVEEESPLNLITDRAFQRETNDFTENLSYNLPTRNEKRLDIITINIDDKGSEESVYKTRIRELPEARVAKFIKKMETEIMPLKIMLNDILHKCSRLGLNDKNKYISRNLILYKTIPSCKNQVQKCCKTEQQIKSNRVVYSIVFEGGN